MSSKPESVQVARLTEKQRRFVEAYLGEADGNAYESARLAGYGGSKRSLEVIGSENLRKPDIRKAIDERTQNGGLVATREERQAFLSKIMRSDTRRINERLKATELLCKMHGDFIERRSVDMTLDRDEQKQNIDEFLERIHERVVGSEESKEPAKETAVPTLAVVGAQLE